MNAKAIIPLYSTRDEDSSTSMLYMKDNEDSIAPSGRYDIRGGICWPCATNDRGISGFAVIIGYNIDNGYYYWLDEILWKTINPVITNGRIEVMGINTWFNTVWLRYKLRLWYYRESRELAWRMRRQIKENAGIMPKPKFYDIDDRDNKYLISVLRELKINDRIVIPKESDIISSEITWSATDETDDMPISLHAFTSVLIGMELWKNKYNK